MRRLKLFFRDDALFFTEGKELIAARNGHMMVSGCLIYGFVLAFYTALTIATKQSTVLRNMYFVFDGVHALLCAAVWLRPARWKENFFATQFLCGVLETSVLCFFALEGSLVSPTLHSLYVPIAILLVQLLFIHRAWYSFVVILLYTALFALLSWSVKSREAAVNDLYIALASFISANIGYVLITKLRLSEQRALMKLEALNRTDALTGIYNKGALEKLCQRRMSAGDGAMVILDLDDFKRINDQYGHDVGDEVIKAMGAVLKNAFRVADIVGRFGGDEFVAFMDTCTDPMAVQAKMDLLCQRIDELHFSAPSLKISCSAGAAFKRPGDDFRSLFVRADQALYKAKRNGGNQIHIENPPDSGA